ncbi:hypothetical protein BHE74_00013057 [Ensete ventricosum]|nr:hypothetical protein BHE74_00013057 [Ensete ventricosum]
MGSTYPIGYRYADRPLPSGTMRLPRGNEATPHLTMRERGDTSSSPARMRRRLVFPRRDEALPRLLARGRGVASSPRTGTRRRVVLPRGDKASFSREARRGNYDEPWLDYNEKHAPQSALPCTASCSKELLNRAIHY